MTRATHDKVMKHLNSCLVCAKTKIGNMLVVGLRLGLLWTVVVSSWEWKTSKLVILKAEKALKALTTKKKPKDAKKTLKQNTDRQHSKTKQNSKMTRVAHDRVMKRINSCLGCAKTKNGNMLVVGLRLGLLWTVVVSSKNEKLPNYES